MAKATLAAMNGLNILGERGGLSSVMTLSAILPRESKSKEVDAAVLSVIGFPAFAVCDHILINRTRTKLIDKLRIDK